MGTRASATCALFLSLACDDAAQRTSGGDPELADTALDLDPRDDGDAQAAPARGFFGAACRANADCLSGFCVAGPAGHVCTEPCADACPEGYDCRSVARADALPIFLCLPRVATHCEPCMDDFQCEGGACLRLDGSGRCALPCEDPSACPGGFLCAPDPLGAHAGRFCQPRSGSCECLARDAGARRACSVTNAIGTCHGVEICDSELGWRDCTAREPLVERCDYLDNDCDGDVDEDFKVAGLYASTAGCGTCTTVCAEVLANAAQTECDTGDGLAHCKVVSCRPGFNLVNDFVCAPDAGNLCAPCDGPAVCLGAGATCVALEDGAHCTRSCVDERACPASYTCAEVPPGGSQPPSPTGKVCVPLSGSCTCDGSQTELARACEVAVTPRSPDEPTVICRGFQRCVAEGWGSCELPAELCDGIDNDCDGVIDDPFRSDGIYDTLEHCGACEVSCAVLMRENAEPACIVTGRAAACGIRCVGGAVDVNGVLDDGCECLPLPGPDLAGDDLDSNCDGVDGEVDNAVFVAKHGDDDAPGTREAPVRTIQLGVTLASARGLRDVYVATAVYAENVVLAEGVGLFGGYSPGFDVHDVARYETTIIGQPGDAEQIGTITASAVGRASSARETVLDGFTRFGVNAANSDGESSYTIYVRDAGPRLRLSKNRVFAGPGGSGRAGEPGGDGSPGRDGMPGMGARNLFVDCTEADESNGGAGGQLTCDGVTDVGGGRGGRARCPDFEVNPGTQARGENGRGGGAGTGGAFGWPLLICASEEGTSPGCDGIVCHICHLPRESKPFNPANGGHAANGVDGAAGLGGTVDGGVVAGRWQGKNGTRGGDGSNGGGGGGGGAAGGVEVEGGGCPHLGNDDVGGSGGGGGSGGCRGRGGGGGTAGGGSFGVFLVAPNALDLPRIVDNVIQAGRGGAGGAGGAAGVGGPGGRGGHGGIAGDVQGQALRCALGGAEGGNGGDGGQGGGGGGGAGGPSYGLYASLLGQPPAAWISANTFIAGGVGGRGGPGGGSLAQSRSGGAGADGRAANTNF